MGCCNNSWGKKNKCCHVSPCCCGRTEYGTLFTTPVAGVYDYNRVYDDRTTSPCCNSQSNANNSCDCCCRCCRHR